MKKLVITDKVRSELIEEAYDMNLQNLNDRLTEIEAFKEGIGVGIDECLEMLNKIPEPTKPHSTKIEGGCSVCGGNLHDGTGTGWEICEDCGAMF